MILINYFITNLIAISIISTSCNTNKSDNFKDNIKNEADKMINFLVAKDYTNYCNYMIPPMIDGMGGRENAIEIIKKEMAKVDLIKVKLSYPSDTVIENQKIQCTLREEIEIKVNEGRLITVSTLIGISNDMGKTWYFLDANNKSLEELRSNLPLLSKRLIFHISDKPTLIKD